MKLQDGSVRKQVYRPKSDDDIIIYNNDYQNKKRRRQKLVREYSK